MFLLIIKLNSINILCMNWLDIKTWKQCIVSTLICLFGCSIGTMGTTAYLIHYNWFIVLFSSFIAGFISCVLFMVLWQIIIHHVSFNDAVKMSVKMSVVSIFIMMLSESGIILIASSLNSEHQMHMHGNMHNYKVMIFAMSVGFLFSLPYNYYQLHNNKEICH